MPHPSAALDDFAQSLGAAQELARIEARYKDPPTPRGGPAVRALRGGFCVLIVGGFERFVSESFAEHLGRLVATPPPVTFGNLPEKLRLSTVFLSLEQATRGPLYGKRGGRAARYPQVIAAARRIVAEHIDPQALGQTNGNPDSARVAEMFKALGVTDVFADVRPQFDRLWNKPEASTFLSDKLDEIVNARHVVAHTADALSVTRWHLIEWPKFLQALATGLDGRLDAYVTTVVRGSGAP